MARTLVGTDLKVMACHFPEELSIIHNVVDKFEPELMIELGTCVGGVTFVLHKCRENVHLHTFDNKSMVQSIKKSGGDYTAEYIDRFALEFNDFVEFYVTDIFTEGKTYIERLLALDKRKIMYCDNGKKTLELEFFAKHMKAGDLLGVHDWDLEINYEYEGVKESLRDFTEHPVNDLLREKTLSTRFFSKVV